MIGSTIVWKLQDILDAKSPTIDVDLLASDNEDRDSDDDALPETQNINYNLAEKEFCDFESFKHNTYWPVFLKKEEGLTGIFQGSLTEISVGPAVSHRNNLPSGKNLFDYIDKQGQKCLLCFYGDHKDRFPIMWILVQREASRQVVEVGGYESFFGLSGYISSPWRTRLGVRNYERLAMLSSILRVVYVNPEWVAEEYLRRCKSSAWKKKQVMMSLSSAGTWRELLRQSSLGIQRQRICLWMTFYVIWKRRMMGMKID